MTSHPSPDAKQKDRPKGGLSAAEIEAEIRLRERPPPADLVTQLLALIYAVRMRAVKSKGLFHRRN
jgi:hypothetical protein